MFARPSGESADGVFVDADQASGLSNVVIVLEVSQHGEGCVVGEVALVQGSSLAFGEAFLAGAAGEGAALVVTLAEAEAEVIGTALTEKGGRGVESAKGSEVIHGGFVLKESR